MDQETPVRGFRSRAKYSDVNLQHQRYVQILLEESTERHRVRVVQSHLHL